MKNIIYFCRVVLLSPPLNFIKSLFGGHKCTTLLIIPLMVIVGCTPNPTPKKREISKPKVDYVNNNPRSDALVVGVGEYKNNIRPLHGVEKDMKNIKKLLRHLNINNINTLYNDKATLDDVREAFDSYISSDKNREGNIFLFYYSGHGVQVLDRSGDEADKKDEATALYNLALDDKDFISEGVLLDDELYSMLGKIKSKKILIFDKCHSGSSHRGYNPYIKAFAGGYQLSSNFLDDIDRRSKTKNDLKDFVIFSATKDDQEAEDSPIGGLFTNSFIDGIQYKKADIDRDNKITVSELEKFCTTNISNLAVNIQREYKGVTLKGNFDPSFRPTEVLDKSIASIFNLKPSSQTEQVTKQEHLLENTLDSLVSFDTIKLSLLGGKTSFKEHDRVRFEITSTKSGYLNIFIAYGDSYRLFMKNREIKEGKLYAFPNDFMARKHLVAKRPLGTTKIYALLSRKPLSINGYLSKREDDLRLTNYLRKGVMILAKREAKRMQNNRIIKKEADILSIGRVEFDVLD